MMNIKKSLEKEVRGCKLLIIWTDCDREGENIGMEVVTVCRAINRGIKVLRAKFSEITMPSIERAMTTLGQICTGLRGELGFSSHISMLLNWVSKLMKLTKIKGE